MRRTWAVLLALGASTSSEAYIEKGDVCEGNLVIIGTVIDRESYYSIPNNNSNPRHPGGRIYTTVTLDVDRKIVDLTNAVVNGEFELTVPGGTVGNQTMKIPERPVMAIGQQYALSMRVSQQAPFPLMIDWSYVPPGTTLPSLPVLKDEWEEYCD